MKQAIVLRKDLKMSAGKVAAQASHASLEAYKIAKPAEKKKWEREGGKKIILAVYSKEELLQIFAAAKKARLPVALIMDAGLTEIPAGTKTAVGIGPAADEKIDKIVGSLKLY